MSDDKIITELRDTSKDDSVDVPSTKKSTKADTAKNAARLARLATAAKTATGAVGLLTYSPDAGLGSDKPKWFDRLSPKQKEAIAARQKKNVQAQVQKPDSVYTPPKSIAQQAQDDMAAGISGKDVAMTIGMNAAQELLLGRIKGLKILKPVVGALGLAAKKKPETTPTPAKPSTRPQRSPVPQPNPGLPLPGPSRGPSRRVRPRRRPEKPATPTETPATPKTPTPGPAPTPTPAPSTPAPRPVIPVPVVTPKPDVKPKPGTTPKPTPVVVPTPQTQPKPTGTPKQDTVSRPDPKATPQQQQQQKPAPNNKGDKKKTTPVGGGFGGDFGRKIRGQDLRTMIGGTGVKEEFVAEEERFKKFKVIYILNGSEKTNVYRYKGKDTFAKARVMRQLRERGAGSIRFMQYESIDNEMLEHEIVRDEDGRYYDDEGNSSSSISKAARRYMVGDNYHPRKNYGYGYKENGRRKALPRSTEKIYHAVSFQQKDAAKEEGMRWDPEVKKWYHSDADKSKASKFKKLEEAYMPDATRKPVVYRAPPKRGEVVGKMKVRLIRRHQDVMPGERTATSDNTKRLRRLIRKVLKKGKLKR